MLRFVLAVVAVALATESIGVYGQKCIGPNWTLYPPEDVCFINFKYLMTYDDARQYCQERDGDLLQIASREFDNFVRDERQELGTYWVGAQDTNKDGVFEFVNGTRLPNSEKGLGFWAQPVLYKPMLKEHCVVLRSKNRGWATAPCSAKLFYLCEKPLTPGQEACDPDWTLYKKENTCILDVLSRMTFDDSRTACQTLGADLVQISNKRKNKFVKALRREPERYMWIGVHDPSETGVFEFVNGSKLFETDKGLGPWGDFSPYDEEQSNYCVLQGKHRGWRNRNCTEEHWFICGHKSYPNNTSTPMKQVEEESNAVSNKTVEENVEINGVPPETLPAGGTKAETIEEPKAPSLDNIRMCSK